MAVMAQLRIQLLAETVVVAESDDAELWRRVFTAIQTGTPRLGQPVTGISGTGSAPEDGAETSAEKMNLEGSAVGRFAAELKIDVEDMVGSSDPSTNAPYIHLNPHNWETLKKNTPERGPTAIAPITLAGTLLALWFDIAKLGTATVGQATAVLDTIKLPTNNTRRGLENCPWLTLRGNSITVNPSQRSRAIRVARAYCTMKPLSEKE